MKTFTEAVVAWRGSTDPDAPLVLLLHGRGSKEEDMIRLADQLPDGPAYAAVRAPIGEGGGYAWFANRGVGRPVAESLAETMSWFRRWLDETAPAGRPVVLVGFSGGAAFAGGLLLDDPGRYLGAAILYGTLPFDAGLPAAEGRLAGSRVLVWEHELLGHDRFLAQIGLGGLPFAETSRSIELLATEVLPAVKREVDRSSTCDRHDQDVA